MRISLDDNCIFKSLPKVTKASSKKRVNTFVATALLCSEAAGKDLFEFEHQSAKMSNNELKNAYGNMLDLFSQLDKAFYLKTKPEKYEKLARRVQENVDKVNNKSLKSIDIDDFVNKLLDLFV